MQLQTENTIQRTSPHIRRRLTTKMCMWHVIIALVPAVICAVFFFGLSALLVMAVSVAACIITEWGIVKYMLGPSYRMSLTAAALTGLLLALNVPSILPLWMIAIGAVFAIGIGKMAFGGLGCNVFNPALTGRVFLLISFPVAMTTWPDAGAWFHTDGATGATILSALKEGTSFGAPYDFSDLALGSMRGSMGEVSAIALLLGLVYLLAVRVISWHIPVSIVLTVILFDICLGVPAAIDVLSGGLLLGAIFMATDYVTSPMTSWGMILYGAMIGIITVIIRRWGAYPEGMSFAILIMNGFVPLINRYFKPRRYGYGKRKESVA